jgi:hypothetical protein
MKKLILLIIAIGFLFGCAGLERIRTVQDDNIFYSSSTPKIRIKINPDFKFENETDSHERGYGFDSGERSSNIKVDKFLFIERVSGKHRGVEIKIQELLTRNWFFTPDIFKPKNQFYAGKLKIQGNTYQYCTFAVKSSNNYLLINGIGRLIGGNNNAMIIIYYLEQATGDWSNFNMLTSEQKKQLDEFIEDSEKDIQILENLSTYTYGG